MATQSGDDALKIRVQRLMHGEFKVEDLTTLFLALRDRAGGRQSIVDVGDFVAHRDERNKGYVTRAVRDFFLLIRFHIEQMERRPTIFDLPPYIAEFLQASARRLNYKAAQGPRKFTRVQVDKALPGLLSCIRPADNGRCFLWPSITNDEIDLVNFLTGNITFQPLITEASLFADFSGALVENDLLSSKEVRDLRVIKGAVSLFALTHMHQCFVSLGGGVTGHLSASPYGGGADEISVVATVPAMDSKGVRFSHAVFLTERTVENDCVAGLDHLSDQDPIWTYPLELGPDKKLRKLGS